jgi:hypothetical protein
MPNRWRHYIPKDVSAQTCLRCSKSRPLLKKHDFLFFSLDISHMNLPSVRHTHRRSPGGARSYSAVVINRHGGLRKSKREGDTALRQDAISSRIIRPLLVFYRMVLVLKTIVALSVASSSTL